jgi:hypothetical protein
MEFSLGCKLIRIRFENYLLLLEHKLNILNKKHY